MSSPSGQAARSAFDEAVRYRQQGMRLQAAESCKKAIGLNGQHVDAWRLWASLSWINGNHTEAVGVLARAADAIPQNALIQADLGLAQLALNHPLPAVQALSRAIDLNPNLAGAHRGLGAAFKLLGRANEAEAAYRRAIRAEPRSVVAHVDLGEMLEQGGRLHEARQLLETALQIDPRSVRTLTLLGKALLMLGDTHSAVSYYRAAAEAEPHGAICHLNLGIALRVAGDSRGAVASLRRAIGILPGQAEAHAHLAEVLLQSGLPGDAAVSAREAIRLNPALSETRISLGAALAALGDLEGAAAEVRNAAAPGTDRGRIFFLLGSRLADAGDADASLECFKKLLEVDPGDAMAQHLVGALTGANVERDPSGYVRSLFDSYADKFDEHLKALGYSTPQKLNAEILAATTLPYPWDCLDLGCGTGLFGVEITARARRLVGVDVSAKMLERCRERGIYTEVRRNDLLTALEGESAESYDLVAAADVFVYVGNLDSIVPAARRVLRRNGVFAFSTESMEHAVGSSGPAARGYLAGAHGRFSHSINYLNDLAVRHDFRVQLVKESPIRMEGARSIIGWLVIWVAGAADHPR